MNNYVIIAAGGSGVRMNSDTPKQFLVLKDEPVILHSIKKFTTAIPGIKIIIVLPAEQFSTWKEICSRYNVALEHGLAQGAETRFHSVKNGLELIKDDGLVAIHDAVRPLVSVELIQRTFKMATEKGNAIPAIELKDSIRELTNGQSKTVDRNKFRLIQTPQCFKVELIKRAYKQNYSPDMTDDATLVEKLGEPVYLVDGEESNIKITTPADLKIAGALC